MKSIVEQLLEYPLYQEYKNELSAFEESRMFCKHDLDHFEEVGRIACIVARENHLSIPEDEILLAAYLHDLGRVKQYESGISHGEASAALAREILCSLECQEEWISEICDAVASHSNRYDARLRYQNAKNITSLAELLSYADHFSRKCYQCVAAEACKWDAKEKITREYYE